MEIHGGGRTIFNRSVSLASLPESAPSTATDGYSMLLEAKLGGGVIPPYILVVTDIAGGASNATVTLDAYLRFEYARFLGRWQLIKRATISDDLAEARTFVIVPTLGANRIAVVAQSSTGSPTSLLMHGRAINDDQAYRLIELVDASGVGVSLSDTPPVDVTTTPASAGTAGEASRQDHKHHIDFPVSTLRRYAQILSPTGNPQIFSSPANYVHGGTNTEVVYYNGQKLLEGSGNDYLATESGGVGTGYDTITTSFTPRASSNWTMDFVPA